VELRWRFQPQHCRVSGAFITVSCLELVEIGVIAFPAG
jgi:hypothetical protein